MRRSILFSLMVIGAVIAVVAGASTFSAFTSTETINGTVTAGTLTIDIEDNATTPSTSSITFDPASACSEMVPLTDTCTATIVVKHGSPSNLEFTYSGDFSESGDTSDCFNGTLAYVSTTANNTTGRSLGTTLGNNATSLDYFGHDAADDGLGDVTDAMDPSDADMFTISVTVDDDNICQGKTATYTLKVTGTQSATPHD